MLGIALQRDGTRARAARTIGSIRTIISVERGGKSVDDGVSIMEDSKNHRK